MTEPCARLGQRRALCNGAAHRAADASICDRGKAAAPGPVSRSPSAAPSLSSPASEAREGDPGGQGSPSPLGSLPLRRLRRLRPGVTKWVRRAPLRSNAAACHPRRAKRGKGDPSPPRWTNEARRSRLLRHPSPQRGTASVYGSRARLRRPGMTVECDGPVCHPGAERSEEAGPITASLEERSATEPIASPPVAPTRHRQRLWVPGSASPPRDDSGVRRPRLSSRGRASARSPGPITPQLEERSAAGPIASPPVAPTRHRQRLWVPVPPAASRDDGGVFVIPGASLVIPGGPQGREGDPGEPARVVKPLPAYPASPGPSGRPSPAAADAPPAGGLDGSLPPPVMAGLVPAIHDFPGRNGAKTWIPGRAQG